MFGFTTQMKLQVSLITRTKRVIEEKGSISCPVSCITRYVPWPRKEHHGQSTMGRAPWAEHHGHSTLLDCQRGGWALFQVSVHLTTKEHCSDSTSWNTIDDKQ